MRMKALIAGVGFAALCLLGSLPAQAQRWEDCRERIQHAQMRLDRAIDRFGRHSERARDARADYENTRDWCWRHNRDRWDHDYRDRDRRHDGYRDRDRYGH